MVYPRNFCVSVFALMLYSYSGYSLDVEPLCSSRYDFDYKMLKEVINLEQKLKELEDRMTKQKTELHQENQKIRLQQKEMTGSVYVRWGRTECPGNGTEIVYSGYAGGSHFDNTGAAVNYLCLPNNPEWRDDVKDFTGGSFMYGAEYGNSEIFFDTLFKTESLQFKNVPCVVCQSSRSALVMIPARTSCYEGWTREYSGYLTAGYYTHPAASEYACLDSSPEIIKGGDSNEDGPLFYSTSTKCGALKCPPYIENHEVACVVCTK